MRVTHICGMLTICDLDKKKSQKKDFNNADSAYYNGKIFWTCLCWEEANDNPRAAAGPLERDDEVTGIGYLTVTTCHNGTAVQALMCQS